MTPPTVSIVVPTFNRRDRLRRVLDALETQTFPLDQFEVIVVSDGSSDGTMDLLRERARSGRLALQVIDQQNQGVSAARNAGVAVATGRLVLFIDDDVVPSADLVACHVAGAIADDVVVLGPMLSPPGFSMQPWVRWEQAMLVKQYDDMAQGRWIPTARQFYTGNTSLARRQLVEAGGFDPTFRRAEDVELGFRLARKGVRFTFDGDAVGWHFAERSLSSWMSIPYEYGRNDVIFSRDKQEEWLLHTIAREFGSRHFLTQCITRLCLSRRVLSAIAILIFRIIARFDFLARFAYSAIFNLRHYQGIADELGGRDLFFAQVRHARRRARSDVAPT
jgi:GT2 family glycosyltransferase